MASYENIIHLYPKRAPESAYKLSSLAIWPEHTAKLMRILVQLDDFD